MSRLYALLFLLAASSQASDILRRRPDPKSAPVTIARREAVASPIVTVPTIILGPSSEYMQTPKSTATVTGSAVTIVEADQKTDGVDIYFGPDAWKSIEAAGKKNCNTPTSPICVPGLQSAISPPGLRLQARGAVFLVVAAIVALVAVVIEQYHLYNTEQPHIHVPYHALTQISSAQGSSTVAYATATDDPSVIIVTSTATQEPLPSISVSTVTADANGHQKGDVLIALPPPLADAVTEYIARTDSCASLKKRSTVSDTCFGDIAGSLMEQTVNNGWAAGLIMQPTQLPQQIPRMLAHYLPIVIAAGQKVSGLARLNKVDFNGLAELVALIVYDKIIEGLKDTPTPTEYVIQASEIADASQTSASGKSSTCPPDDRIPCCPNCGGDNGNRQCNGIKAAKDAWKGCPCIGNRLHPYKPFPNKQAYKDAQALLLNLPDLNTGVAAAAATATGSAIPPQYVPIDGKYKIRITTYAGAVNGPPLVVRVDEDTSGEGLTTSNVRGADLLQPLQPGQIAIHVDGDQTSQNQLVQLTVTDGTGKVDKIDMNYAGGANVQHSCEAPGAWSSDKPPARTVVCHIQTLPTAPDNWYRVDFHEEMAREDSSLQWTLYTDAWNQKIGGPDTGKVVSGHPMPDSMTLFVKDPTNTKALIQISYGHCEFYDSDQDSKSKTDWCGPNQNWVPLGAGFKRDFSCHFQGRPGPANC